MSRTKTPFFPRTPTFDRVDDQVFRRILLRSESVDLVRRGILWRRGEAVTSIGWVRSGVVRERIEQDGRDLILGLYGRGEVVGEVGAFSALLPGTQAVQHACLDAHEASSVVCLPLADLTELLAQEPVLALGLAATCAERRRRMEERLAALVFRSVRSRLASSLMDLAARFGVRDSRGVIVNLRLTHRDLAGLAGASRETASTALLEWRRDGLVAIEGKRVVLLDSDRLSAVARDA